MSNKQGLIDYLKENGKDKSWSELAEQFEFKNHDHARMTWLKHRKGDDVVKPFEFKEGELRFGDIIPQIHKTYIAEFSKRVLTKVEERAENFQDRFVEFLKVYSPKRNVVAIRFNPAFDTNIREDSILIINKQDAHLNKYDVDGENDINKRFKSYENAVDKVLYKASVTNNLSAIGYIIGSDQFNSEFMGTTTKGTPQQNILDYHKSFQAICDHEVTIIEKLAANTEELHVMFIGGNHDEYVGWHMAKWLEAYFRNDSSIIIDASEDYTKYVQFGNTAMMFNHGDEVKPDALAKIFPIGAKHMWSDCDHRYIFTGDKHHNLAKDFNGIEFYQLPQLSKAKSLWDKKRGYDDGAKPGMVSFIITQNDGMSDIIKTPLK